MSLLTFISDRPIQKTHMPLKCNVRYRRSSSNLKRSEQMKSEDETTHGRILGRLHG